MEKSDLVLLYAYNRWANAKVREASSQVTHEQLFAPAQASFGSLMGTLAHILGTEITWRTRLQEGLSPTRIDTAADFPTLQRLSERWQAEEARMQAFVEGLDGADVNRWISFTTTSGKPQGSTLWRALAHVVNHGTAFRAEAGAVLAAFGHSPGDLDLIYYLRETDQR